MAAHHYVNPRWGADGMEVWIPWNPEKNCWGHDGKGTACRCTVAIAFGDALRVVNTQRGIDRTLRYDQVYVPPNSPYAFCGGHVPKSLITALTD